MCKAFCKKFRFKIVPFMKTQQEAKEVQYI